VKPGLTYPRAKASYSAFDFKLDRAMLAKKPWGDEILFAKTSRYVGKILRIRAGRRLSLQYHIRKEETILVVEGTLTAEKDGKTLTLTPGETLHIPARTIHRLGAPAGLLDKWGAVLFEVSTPEITDVVRLEDDYGRRGIDRRNEKRDSPELQKEVGRKHQAGKGRS